MLKIGLTGGIGCGKSTVSELFKHFNIPIIDADEISHALVRPNQLALKQIVAIFGSKMLLENGELNRFYLKQYIFKNKQAKKQLEAILHPLIFQEISNQLTIIPANYCVISIPLLFETQSQFLFDRILVIDCDEKEQIERVKKRDNLSEEQIKLILSAQVSRDFRLTYADDVIDNSKKKQLAQQVKKLHNFYLFLSHKQDALPL